MGMGKRFADASMAKVASIEKRLSGIMRPVTPRKEFIRGLGHRIQDGSRAAFVNHVANWHIIALLVAGVVSIGVFVAMVIRAVASLGAKKRTA